MSIINLLPSDYIQSRCRRRANALCLGLFAIVMVGVLGAWAASERSSNHTRDVLDRLNVDYGEAAKLIDRMRRLEVQQIELRRKAKMTASLVERVPRSTILAVITNARPSNLAIVELGLVETKKKSSAPPGTTGTKFAAALEQRTAQPARRTVEMRVVGLATTDVEVARFIANLARNPLIQSVDLVYTEDKLVDERSAREFELTLVLTPDVDAVDIAREARRKRPSAAAPAISTGSRQSTGGGS